MPVLPRRRAWVAALACATFACAGGPCGLLPGGALDGEVRGAPADWAFAGDSGTAQLETQADEPYSVNLVYTIVDDTLYINAGNTETNWVRNLEADPAVRLRIDEVVYELRAERVTDDTEIARFGKAWTSQSMFRRDPTGFDEVWIYRLRAR